MTEKIIILDFGSQYTQLIARRVRELNVFCEIIPYNKPFDAGDTSIKGIILSGSPFSVRDKNALRIDLNEIVGKKPVLGICYGAQLLTDFYGGKVKASKKREYGKARLKRTKTRDKFLSKIATNSQVWMSHADTITQLPKDFEVLAGTESIPVAAFRSPKGVFAQPVYGIQFHPEVTHTEQGSVFFENFVKKIAGCKGDWTPDAFVEATVADLRATLGKDKVILGLSGGVDSTVAAALLQKAIGRRLTCIFIDNGLLRKNEFEEVLASYKGMGLKVIGIRAEKAFYKSLKGKKDPEAKRKAIGKTFIEIFQKEGKKLKDVKWLGQGTIYPDVIESVSVHGPSVTIKSHHNVGALPKKMKLKTIEPLRMLFKDEVRKVGAAMKVSPAILKRHPFPGPGLGIRILGKITPAKVKILQEADAIFIKNLKKYDLYDKIWQAATILLPIQSVGVMGDERTYEKTVVLRAVNSVDGMTAVWSPLPHDFLAKVSSEIINQIKGINRVVYDISTKPPATIEWE